jgi:hypothetical protein
LWRPISAVSVFWMQGEFFFFPVASAPDHQTHHPL